MSSKGNEYFCEVEEDYILDRFNLTGLNTEVQHYAQALDMITDNLGARNTALCVYSPLIVRRRRDSGRPTREPRPSGSSSLRSHPREMDSNSTGTCKNGAWTCLTNISYAYTQFPVHLCGHSLRSTSAQTSAAAHAYSASLNRSFPSALPTCRTRSPSSCTAAAARISTLRNPHATVRSTARTLAPHSPISSSSYTLISSHQRADPSTSVFQGAVGRLKVAGEAGGSERSRRRKQRA